jgi:hypothetical protein
MCLEVSSKLCYRDTPMSQACHKPRRQLAQTQGTEAKCWRATKYELSDIDGRAVIEATPDAKWELFSPFDSYQPTAKTRALKSGPHLEFLSLKCLWEKHQEGELQLPHESLRQMGEVQEILSHTTQKNRVRQIVSDFAKYRIDLISFAEQYGLLGAFEEEYVGTPVLPDGKTFVAPEAVIDERGRLRHIDPATEGKAELFKLLKPLGHFSGGHSPWRSLDAREYKVAYETMALPSEITFPIRGPHLGGLERSVESRRLMPWEGIREYFGGLTILDNKAPEGVSVLCTREPLHYWEVGFRFFPSGAPSGALELDEDGHIFLNAFLEEVSPRAFIGEAGNLERGWRYRSLLQAMYIMLFLDLTGGNTIKKCKRRKCSNYFRVGSQSKSIYCTPRCASAASTSMKRGQEP